MGYTHGIEWDDSLIEYAIKDVIKIAKLDNFPTHKQMNEATGSMALSNAVSKHGGTRYWADRLGLDTKPCESKLGEEYEVKCMEHIKHLGYRCEKTPHRHPYDILVENNVKVDVKCGNLYHGASGDFYTFNLEKSMPTCDIFVCYCLQNERVEKVFVIPSTELSGNTQLSIGKVKSKYDLYRDAWGVIRSYDEFFKGLKAV